MSLCVTWLKFLDHAGRYTKRYYLARDLELPRHEQDPRSYIVMVKHYETEANLLGTIKRDLGAFPEELLAIRDAQVACDLRPFSDRQEYLADIVMGFTMLDRHGKERRNYYRRRINSILKKLQEGKAVAALSLNQLEAGFIECQRKAEARRAKKAA